MQDIGFLDEAYRELFVLASIKGLDGYYKLKIDSKKR